MLRIPLWQRLIILFVVLMAAFFSLPSLFPQETRSQWPQWLSQEGLKLGLDLQGGSYLLAEVQMAPIFQEVTENTADNLRVNLRKGKIPYQTLSQEKNYITLQVEAAQETVVSTLLQEVAADFSVEKIATENLWTFTLRLKESAQKEKTKRILEQSLEIVRRRLDETGTQEPSIQQHGTDRILIQLPGLKDPERIKKQLQATAKLTFHLVEEGSFEGSLPFGVIRLPSAENEQAFYPVSRRVLVSGENLIDAQASFETGEPVVSFRFDTLGAKRFGEATQKNVGRLFAAVLDGKVVSAPRIEEPILGGSGIIRGSFTVTQTQDLALLLRAGALPAPLLYLEERSVGPSLGQDSIQAGTRACFVAFLLVMLCMWLVYGSFGWFANFALLVNVVLIFGALSALQATLTLPGIAGIVLTLGMAVDSNVLIFERIREELSTGKGPVTAIDAGYRRAITTILDSNLTTLIAALFLFHFGSGPVKGFAVTLALGLCTSMFTSVLFTRWTISTWLRWRKPKTLALYGGN